MKKEKKALLVILLILLLIMAAVIGIFLLVHQKSSSYREVIAAGQGLCKVEPGLKPRTITPCLDSQEVGYFKVTYAGEESKFKVFDAENVFMTDCGDGLDNPSTLCDELNCSSDSTRTFNCALING